MHLIAIAQAAGLSVTWDDFSALSKVTPLIARVYPNGSADVNRFMRRGVWDMSCASYWIRVCLLMPYRSREDSARVCGAQSN